MIQKHFVIGVDGGGAKTTAILADLNGKILAKATTGSSHPRNLGLAGAINSVAFAVKGVLNKIKGKKNICVTFLGLPAMEEEFKFKKNLVKKELLKHKEISPIFKGKVIIDSDQSVGFRSGTKEKDGVVLIAGSGSVCRGWKNGKEAMADSCGYLSEAGSAFFVGQKTLRLIFKDLDGRGKKTLSTKLVFRELKVKNRESLIGLIYKNAAMDIIPFLAICCNSAAEKGDEEAKNILLAAGKELALSAKIVIKKLSFQNKKFPLVLVGSMFNSKIVLGAVKKEIKKFAAEAELIRPEAEPAMGAVELAIEDAADKIAGQLKKKKVIVCPTDTVYGLIADATSKKAVDKVFEIKKRPKTKPIPIFVKDLQMAKKLAIINKNQESFLKKVWPGKTTVVLKLKNKNSIKIKNQKLKIYGINRATIALRIPNHKVISHLLSVISRPLTGTSANISGKPASGKIKEVIKQFTLSRVEGPDLIIDGGDLNPSKPSKVIDLTSKKPKILRN